MMKGVCVFDIDNTLTCGRNICDMSKLHYMKESINMCKSSSMGVVINTARPPQEDILHSINPEIRNLLGDNVKVYSRSRNSVFSVEEQKLLNMTTIAKECEVDVSKTVLVDDLSSTCSLLTQKNIPNIHVNDENGISDKDYSELKRIVESM